MSVRGVAPDCKRIHFDLPLACYELLRAEAADPPAISVAEYCRRLVAWRLGYELPTAEHRKEQKLRLTGTPKKRTGPRPKYLSAQTTTPRGTSEDEA